MKVWIDQSECQNSGLCEESAPTMFGLGDDDLAYVRLKGRLLTSPGGAACQIEVPEEFVNDVEEAARECPAQCIHIEDQPA